MHICVRVYVCVFVRACAFSRVCILAYASICMAKDSHSHTHPHAQAQTQTLANTHTHIHIHISSFNIPNTNDRYIHHTWSTHTTGWRRPVGCLKL